MYTRNTRQATVRLLEMIADGSLNPVEVIIAAVNYMSESDVADMCESEGYFDMETV